MSEKKKSDSFISVRAFLSALIVIAILMLLTYILTIVIPCEGIPFWKWILSPVLVLGSSDSTTILGLLVFLLIVGGVFNSLNECGLMRYMVDVLADRFSGSKYKLMAVVILFFMCMGSLIGCFEEVVPLVPIVTALAIRLGWDALTGVGMSLLAVGCGFAAGVFNPFTVGMAQQFSGLSMFSGAWFRAIGFVLIYALLLLFVRSHAKKVDRGSSENADPSAPMVRDPKMGKGLRRFAIIIGIGIAAVFSSALLTFLRDYTFIIVALMFLVAGIVSCFTAGFRGKPFGKSFAKGILTMLPAVLMILMASSIKFTLQEAGAMDTILNAAISAASKLPRWAIILFIYLIVLVMNFFVASGSAKVIMLIPLIVPVAEAFGIPAQLCIVAFAFGDGFSNVFYPTNAALLISLGLAEISYPRWFRWNIRFQSANLILTSLLLLLGLAVGLC